MPKVWPVFGLFEDDRVLDIPEDGEEPVKIVSLKDYFIVATTTGRSYDTRADEVKGKFWFTSWVVQSANWFTSSTPLIPRFMTFNTWSPLTSMCFASLLLILKHCHTGKGRCQV